MKRVSTLAVAALITLSVVSSSYAIAGLGFHWGFDYSLSMEGVEGEKVGIPPDMSDLPEDVQGALTGKDFITVSRTNWRRSAINFGGKAYIDFIPVIEAIEVSCNFGLWQYDGSLSYADFSAAGLQYIANNGKLRYTNVPLTTESAGLSYIGLDGTPYAKLQLDATVRKTIVDFWIVKLSGGAGVSSHFATPLLTARLVEDVVGPKLRDPAALEGLLKPGGSVSKDIVQKIIAEAMGKPVVGMHILLGVKAKLPVVPIGLYADGKYMIPFTKYDSDAGDKSINGFGLLLNAGLSLSI
ncbi:MAG: hypothetical protein LBB74_04715 [Chitinispirillales bacterium]|jgi:hypothetical protein|nr:hypothetical protein [Chitinispirillales bacterium]